MTEHATTPPATRLMGLYQRLIEAMHAAHTRPCAHTSAQKQDARNDYTAALRETFG